ncbi:MAG: hypothetical protein E5W20_03825 [Mesorhizobium sp.]|nr:MAG: hypothetical protein E5W20_03825 [Mesorhizobium sp.]
MTALRRVRGREGRRRRQRLKLGKTAQTVTLSKRDCSSGSIVIVDPASGRLGRLKEDDGNDAVKGWMA